MVWIGTDYFSFEQKGRLNVFPANAQHFYTYFVLPFFLWDTTRYDHIWAAVQKEG